MQKDTLLFAGGNYYDPTSQPPAAGYYTPQTQNQPPAPFPGQQYMSDPMASMAMQYGGTLADQGKEYMQQNVSVTYHYTSLCSLCCFFSIKDKLSIINQS